MMTRLTFWKRIIYTVVGVIFGLLLINGETWYWNYAPDSWLTPLVIYGEPGEEIKIINKTLHPGDEMRYVMDYEKKKDLCPDITRQIRNTIVYTYAMSTPPSKNIGRQQGTFPLPIPREAEYGKYRLYWTAIYEVGPKKREIRVSARSEEFEVVPGVVVDPITKRISDKDIAKIVKGVEVKMKAEGWVKLLK
jgi:hypothetical protein